MDKTNFAYSVLVRAKTQWNDFFQPTLLKHSKNKCKEYLTMWPMQVSMIREIKMSTYIVFSLPSAYTLVNAINWFAQNSPLCLCSRSSSHLLYPHLTLWLCWSFAPPLGATLVVQWLRLCLSNAGGSGGLIPGQGTMKLCSSFKATLNATSSMLFSFIF